MQRLLSKKPERRVTERSIMFDPQISNDLPRPARQRAIFLSANYDARASSAPVLSSRSLMRTFTAGSVGAQVSAGHALTLLISAGL